MLIELNETNFDKETSIGLKVVEFYATWCTYCKNQRIELEELKDSDIWIGLVDGDESPDIAKRFKINAYPTFVVLKDGQKIGQFAGFHKKSELLNRLMNFKIF